MREMFAKTASKNDSARVSSCCSCCFCPSPLPAQWQLCRPSSCLISSSLWNPGFQNSGINKVGRRLMAVFLPLILCSSPHLLTFLVPTENARHFYYAFIFILLYFYFKIIYQSSEFIIHPSSLWETMSLSQSQLYCLPVNCFYLCFPLCAIFSFVPSLRRHCNSIT